MKILVILEAGIPSYRNFLFESLANREEISELLILHNGRIYNGNGEYNSKQLKYIGGSKIGTSFGVLWYLFRYDIVISSYNLRVLSCWLPVFFKKGWIFWGKGLGTNESRFMMMLRKITARFASSILVYNEVKRDEFIRKIGCRSDKIVAYQNTIDISNPGYCDTIQTHFMYFGRIQERKGLENLVLEYEKYLNLRISDGKFIFKLKFVGNGDYRSSLVKLVSNLSLEEYIEFHDGVYSDELIKAHFSNTLAYVSPYNVGLAVINSLAYGVPVVTCSKYQIGPEYNYLDSGNSFIFDNTDLLHMTLAEISDLDLTDMRAYCYSYYASKLKANIMVDNFVDAITSVYNAHF